MTKAPEIEISNLPSHLTAQEIETIVNQFVEAFNLNLRGKSLEIIFLNSEEIRDQNRKHRNIDSSTDVLSFPQANQPYLDSIFGTILISPEDASAKREEIPELVKHGLLHLAGYDHDIDKEAWVLSANKINHRMGT